MLKWTVLATFILKDLIQAYAIGIDTKMSYQCGMDQLSRSHAAKSAT